MVIRVEAENFVQLSETIPVLDVRSPGEYQSGHIPGAISFPLFTDEERAVVGTLYKQEGKEKAVDQGLKLVEPKIAGMFGEGQRIARDKKVLVHCWRGGKRSESVAWLLSLSGIEVYVLEGGYKFFRRWTEKQFEHKYSVQVIGGRTGSGKTEVLKEIEKQGGAIIDLEEMADHKGSAFGRLGATREVSQQQFENDLAVELFRKREKQLWVEDESRGLGKLVIPEPFWKQMRSANVYFLDLSLEQRSEILMRTYGIFSKEELSTCVHKISERLGGLRTKEALEAIESGASQLVITMMLEYYDKLYSHGLSKRDPKTIVKFSVEKFDAGAIAKQLLLM